MVFVVVAHVFDFIAVVILCFLVLELVVIGKLLDLLGLFSDDLLEKLVVALVNQLHCLLKFRNAVLFCCHFVVKLLNMKTEFIDDSPCNHMLLGEPRPRFLISRLSEEDAEVQQVAELVALVNIYVHAGLCSEAALLMLHVWVYCADELAVTALGPVFALERVGELVRKVGNAAVKQ